MSLHRFCRAAAVGLAFGLNTHAQPTAASPQAAASGAVAAMADGGWRSQQGRQGGRQADPSPWSAAEPRHGDYDEIFRVSDREMLDRVEAGDKVRFSADKMDGQFTITQIEALK